MSNFLGIVEPFSGGPSLPSPFTDVSSGGTVSVTGGNLSLVVSSSGTSAAARTSTRGNFATDGTVLVVHEFAISGGGEAIELIAQSANPGIFVPGLVRFGTTNAVWAYAFRQSTGGATRGASPAPSAAWYRILRTGTQVVWQSSSSGAGPWTDWHSESDNTLWSASDLNDLAIELRVSSTGSGTFTGTVSQIGFTAAATPSAVLRRRRFV